MIVKVFVDLSQVCDGVTEVTSCSSHTQGLCTSSSNNRTRNSLRDGHNPILHIQFLPESSLGLSLTRGTCGRHARRSNGKPVHLKIDTSQGAPRRLSTNTNGVKTVNIQYPVKIVRKAGSIIIVNVPQLHTIQSK